MKAKNFLTKISYRCLNKNDHANILFVVDWYSFIVQNLNPFSLERKFNSLTDQLITYLLRRKLYTVKSTGYYLPKG